MAQLWLPVRTMLRQVREERDLLLNRLVELRVLVPGAKSMELQELRDLVQWQEERTLADAKAALWRPANRPKKHTREQVHEALLDYYRKKVLPRRENRKWLYQGSGVEALS